MPPGQTLANLKRVHNAFAVLAQLCSEMGTLIDANPGHITVTSDRHRRRGIQEDLALIRVMAVVVGAAQPIATRLFTTSFDLCHRALPKGANQWPKSNEVSSSPPTKSFRAWPRPGHTRRGRQPCVARAEFHAASR